MRALIIQQDHVSPTGAVGDRLADRGVELSFHEVVPEDRHYSPNVEPRFPEVTDFDLVVAMGAPWSVYDTATIGAWVGAELDLLRQADASGIPVLGICFGGQMLAAAHGGAVVRSEVEELGWVAIRSDDPSLIGEGPWFQWHMDRWELPPGAREIARNDVTSQAFVLRRNLAVQFHPELDTAMLKLWLDNGGDAELISYGRNPDEIMAETVARADQARAQTTALVDAFLDRVAHPDQPLTRA